MIKKLLILLLTVNLLSGCAMFGKSNVEIAPYTVIKQDAPYEIRHYEQLILVTTDMNGLDQQRSPFSKLFDYISGKNQLEQKIQMTAPVFMDQSDQTSETMSFVLPKDFAVEDAPLPQDASIRIENLTDYTVATITFDGRLTQDNIQQHIKLLKTWIKKHNLKIIGGVKAAGYNPPFTIPSLRRNEILIPVKINKSELP